MERGGREMEEGGKRGREMEEVEGGRERETVYYRVTVRKGEGEDDGERCL